MMMEGADGSHVLRCVFVPWHRVHIFYYNGKTCIDAPDPQIEYLFWMWDQIYYLRRIERDYNPLELAGMFQVPVIDFEFAFWVMRRSEFLRHTEPCLKN